jgi:hypothetical protein
MIIVNIFGIVSIFLCRKIPGETGGDAVRLRYRKERGIPPGLQKILPGRGIKKTWQEMTRVVRLAGERSEKR